MKKILQIDGGDIRGIIPAIVCASMEEKLQKPLNTCVDLIVGCSTGSVIGGSLAAGVPAKTIAIEYQTEVVKDFTSQKHTWAPWTWLKPVYDRDKFLKTIGSYIPATLKMGDLPCDFIATVFNLCSDRTHFIKSYTEHEKNYSVLDVISWSALSAAWFFGGISVEDFPWTETYPDGRQESQTGALFQDGGQGVNLNTVGFSMVEAIARGWCDAGEEIVLISLGTWGHRQYTSLKEAEKYSYLRQAVKMPAQARNESTILQVGSARYIGLKRQGMKFFRLEETMDKKYLGFGQVEYKDVYVSAGNHVAQNIPPELYDLLRS